MKLYFVFFITVSFLVTLLSAQTPLSKVIVDGKWYNEEYSFTFMPDGTYKAYYTFGKTNGSMTGKYTIDDARTVTVKRGKVERTFNAAFMNGDSVVLFYGEDPQSPKSTRILQDDGSNIALWNDKTFVKEGKNVSCVPDNVQCVTCGYTLTSTTDNVRIRKGPGTDYEYMTFYYKDAATGVVKSHASVLAGTNIRILAKTAEKFKVAEWYNNWYYIEYKEPNGELIVYKNAWMFGEFINVPENKNRTITITSPENEEAFYGSYSLTVIGSVTGAPVSMKYQLKNAYGNSIFDGAVSEFDQQEGTFNFELSKSNDSLFIGTNIINVIALYSDGKKVSKQITVFVHEGGGEMAKPVIYLYPEKDMSVSVVVKPKNGISISIPPYLNGWNVTAKPDGTIINSADGKIYPYLFWESSNYEPKEITEGFVVRTLDLGRFFKEKLATLGLTVNEIHDFTEYWIPLLNKKQYYLISFYTKKTIDSMAPLTITPAPQTVIRVFFDSKPLDAPIKITPQQLTPKQRVGFTVVEWGGMKY